MVLGWIKKMWLKVFPAAREAAIHQEAIEYHNGSADKSLARTLAALEEKRARLLRRASDKEPLLERLAEQAEAEAALLRSVGLEREEFDALTEEVGVGEGYRHRA